MSEDNEVNEVAAQPVENHHQLAFLISDWHNNVMIQLSQAAHVPDGVKVSGTLREGEEVVELQGDARDAFKCGIKFALGVISKLPFTVVSEEVPVEDAEASQD